MPPSTDSENLAFASAVVGGNPAAEAEGVEGDGVVGEVGVIEQLEINNRVVASSICG